MGKDEVGTQSFKKVLFVIVIVVMSLVIGGRMNVEKKTDVANKETDVVNKETTVAKKQITILAASENKDLEYILQDFAKKNNIKINVTYKEDLDIPKEIAKKDAPYDMVWSANSLSLDMNESNPMLKYRKSIAIDPIVIGIKKSKAEQLGFINKKVLMKDILETVKDKKIKLIMTSPTEYISGTSAYLSFVKAFSGVEEAVAIEDLEKPELKQQLKDLFREVGRAPEGAENLGTIYSRDKYDGMINYEHFLINKNKELIANKEDPLYLIYPNEGVFLADLPFAYFDKKDRKTEEIFKQLQSYLLSEEIQLKLQESGRRTGYGGVMANSNKKVFNPEWGIDITKQLLVQKYPSKQVIDRSLKLCETDLKKPTYIVFCIDCCSRFHWEIYRTVEAIEYILSVDKISEHHIQFSAEDKISILAYDAKIIKTWERLTPTQPLEIIKILKDLPDEDLWSDDKTYIPLTNAYDLACKADVNFYSPAIIVIPNYYSKFNQENEFKKELQSKKKNVPVYVANFTDFTRDIGLEFENPIKNLTTGQMYEKQEGLVQLLQKIK